MKSWPDEGPELLWFVDGLGEGYSSVSVTDKAIYVTGREDSLEYLTAFDLKGNQIWRIPYGLGVRKTWPGTTKAAFPSPSSPTGTPMTRPNRSIPQSPVSW